MTKMWKRPISLLLVVMMIVGMFTILPITASAAPADFSSDTKTVFVTDSQNWDSDGVLQAYYWKVETSYPAPDYNKVETVVDGAWVATTYLYDNNMNQSVYGVCIPDDANRVLFNRDNTRQSTDTSNVYDGSWWYIDGNKNCVPVSGDVFDTTEQNGSLSKAFVDNTGADEYYKLDGRYYFVDANGDISPYNNVQELYVAKDVATGNWYTSVNEAVAAAGENGTVQLVADITGNVGIDGDYTTTLDLNGHTITNTSGSGITLYSKYNGDKTFTIKDTSEGQTGAITINKKYTGDGCISDSSGRKVVIEGGTYTSDANALYVSSDNGWTINGGTFNGDIKVVSALDITGGTINGDINATGPSWKVDPAEVTISGGTVNGSLNSENGSTYAVSGGTFNTPVLEDYCADGYIPKDNGDGTYGVKVGDYVAQTSDGTKYESIGDAIAAAAATDTITILDDVNIGDDYYYVNKNITFDLNGKTVTGNDTFVIAQNGATVTIDNGKVTSSATDWVLYSRGEGTKLIIGKDAVIESTDTSNSTGVITVYGGGTVDVYGTITSRKYGVATFGSGTVNVYDGATIITNGAACAISGNGSTGEGGYAINVYGGTLTSTNDVAIYHPNQGTLNITGGTITGATAIYIKSGSTSIADSSTSIEGATIIGNGAATEFVHSGNGCNPTGDAIVIENCGYPGGTPNVAISGGTITSANAEAVASYGYQTYEPIKNFISGGTFSSAVPEEFCANGYIPEDNGDGTYGVKEGAYVAQVGETKYEDLQAAIDAAGASGTVTLLADCGSGDKTYVNVAADQNITIDFGDYTYTSVWGIENHGTLTLTANNGGATAQKAVVDNYGTLVIDDGNYVATADNYFAILNRGNASATINDGSITASGTSSTAIYNYGSGSSADINGGTVATTSTGSTVIWNNAGATTTIDDGEINAAAGGWGVVVRGQGSSVTMTDGTINAAGDSYGISGIGNASDAGYSITVSGGTINGGQLGIYHPNEGSLTITGGSISGDTGVYVKSGTTTVTDVNITGGTITGNGPAVAYNYNGNGGTPTGDALVIDNCGYPGGAPTVAISGGTFVSTNAKAVGSYNTPKEGDATTQAPIQNFISGGTFSSAVPEEFCKDGYIPKDNGDGTYGVKEGAYVAQNETTGAKYEDLQAAINEASNGDTVTVLTNIALTGSKWFTINGKDLTIDLGGNTISSEDSVFVIYGGAEVTIKNGTMSSTISSDYPLYTAGAGTVVTLASDATLNLNAASGSAGAVLAQGSTVNIYGTVNSNVYGVVPWGAGSTVNVYDGAAITTTGDCACLSGNGSGGANGYTFNISGGTLTSANGVAIYHPNQGTLNITGGTISGDTAIYIKSGSTNISDGSTSITGATIHGTGAASQFEHTGNGFYPTGDAIVIENCGYPGGTPNVAISGGTIISDNAQDVGSYSTETYLPIKNFVSGGSFAHAVPAEQCAEGFVPAPLDPETGMYTVVPEQKLVNKHSISLNGNIDLNFYMNPAVVHDGDTINITWDKGSASWTIKQSDLDLAYGYKVKVELPAAEMTYKLHVTDAALDSDLYYDDYSVRDYCDAILASNPSKELARLVKTMLDYGAKAQVNFKTNTGDLANAGIDYTMDGTVTDEMITDVIDAANGGEGSHIDDLNAYLNGVATDLDAKYYTSSLIYLSGDTLRLYFTPTTWPSEMPNAADYDGNKSSYYYYVQKYGIEAANLDVMQTFTVGGHEFRYSALDYVRAVLSSGNSTEAQQNLAKATYWYNVAANAYFV